MAMNDAEIAKLAANVLSEFSGYGEMLQADVQADGYKFVVRYLPLEGGAKRVAEIICDSNGTRISRTEHTA